MSFNDISDGRDDGRYQLCVTGSTTLGRYGRRYCQQRNHSAPRDHAVFEQEIANWGHNAPRVHFRLMTNTNCTKSRSVLNTSILENVAINDVLPLKAARRDSIANLKCFGGLGHQRPNSDGYIYIHYAAPSYSARISAVYFLPFGNVWVGSPVRLPCETQCRIYEGWVRTLILF